MRLAPFCFCFASIAHAVRVAPPQIRGCMVSGRHHHTLRCQWCGAICLPRFPCHQARHTQQPVFPLILPPPRARMTPHLPKSRMLHRRFPPHVRCKQDYQPSSLQVPTCPLVGVARRSPLGTSLHAQVATKVFMPSPKKGPNASDVFAECVTPHQGMLCGPASPLCIGCMMPVPSPPFFRSNGYARRESENPSTWLHREWKKHGDILMPNGKLAKAG